MGLDLCRTPESLGSAQCPTCGRFCRVVRIVNDSAPLSAEESFYVVVQCPAHGRGTA